MPSSSATGRKKSFGWENQRTTILSLIFAAPYPHWSPWANENMRAVPFSQEVLSRSRSEIRTVISQISQTVIDEESRRLRYLPCTTELPISSNLKERWRQHVTEDLQMYVQYWPFIWYASCCSLCHEKERNWGETCETRWLTCNKGTSITQDCLNVHFSNPVYVWLNHTFDTFSLFFVSKMCTFGLSRVSVFWTGSYSV